MTHLTDLAPFIASYGYSRRPMYRVTVVTASSGRTARNAHWAYPLHMFGLPMNNRRQVELEQVLEYFHAAGGPANTFNFFDRSEDRSCGLADTPAQDDVTLGTATASQTDFQLIKTYTKGGRTQARKITRPVDGSVLVEVNGALQTLGTDYTIEPLGLIRFASGLIAGDVVKAGFRFYVPVAFASDDVDIIIHNYSGAYVGDGVIDLIEVRE